MIQIDIDMPKRCEECPLCVDYDCIIHKRVTDEYYDGLKEQYAHCPLIVPSSQTHEKRTETRACDCISRQDAIDALWKALYDYEDETEKQFQESEDLDLRDWIGHRIFVQNMSDIDRQTILNLPSVQPDERMLHESCTDCPLYDKDRHSCPRFNKVIPETLRELQSAQPEITRCRDCNFYDGRPCGIVDYYNSADDFCSRAERRQK